VYATTAAVIITALAPAALKASRVEQTLRLAK
jgi:hypothetical protein